MFKHSGISLLCKPMVRSFPIVRRPCPVPKPNDKFMPSQRTSISDSVTRARHAGANARLWSAR